MELRSARVAGHKKQGARGAEMVGDAGVLPANAETTKSVRSACRTKSNEKDAKPFLKWAGGKSQLLKEIARYYPFEDGKITKYAEPFVGGGAVLFDILNKFELREIYVGDINAELINAYCVIRDEPDALITMLQRYQNEYVPMASEERKGYFLKKRARFNDLKKDKSRKVSLEKAALMIFLNKTCFNGLYRVNRKGLFNVPIGAYKKPLICDEGNLRAVSEKLRNVTIVQGDYRAAADFIDENTFVYFDPPYRPLTDTARFTGYTENLFDDERQAELAKFVDEMSRKGAKVLVSNSDPKNTNAEDEFFETVYAGYKIERVEATRMINCNSELRGKIKELLIRNFERSVEVMIQNGTGGGNTKTGLAFEDKTDLATALNAQTGYRVSGGMVYCGDKKVAQIFKKNELYRYFKKIGIDWKELISKQLLPDNSIYVFENNTFFVIECKYQQVPGSVDEKLQTCDFKRKQYQKLMAPLGARVEYIYLLSTWFRDARYRDVLEYITSVGCHYYFESIPIAAFGLPEPPDAENG